MEYTIEILKERLEKLNVAYNNHVLNGSVKIDSNVAIDNRKKAKDIEDALLQLVTVSSLPSDVISLSNIADVSGSDITDADKALAILKAFHDIAHNSEQNEGVIITKDWDINTLTIETKEGHNHFGQMNSEDEKGFSILLNEIYRHYVR